MITVRSAEEKDLPQILEIYNHSIVHTTAVYQYAPHTPEMLKKWFEDKKAANHPVYVAEADNRVAGFCSYGAFRAWAGYKYTVEHMVHVHTDYRRRGVARLLVAKIIETAKQNNIHAIIGGIDSANTASIKLHEQFLFKEVAHFKEVGYKFDKWLDVKFFELLLETPANPVQV